jgi:hypothetical protein
MLINLTHEQLTAALFALREQSAQQRTVATERRRMAREQEKFIDLAGNTPQLLRERTARRDHLNESAAALEHHSSTLDAIAQQLADGASEGPY